MNTDTTPRRRPPIRSAVKPLPDFAFAIAPEGVKEPSLAYAHALQAHDEARRAARMAMEAIGLARQDDEHAAIAATREGKAPPKPTVPKAAEAAEAAARSVPASEAVAREGMGRFCDAVAAHLDEFEATAEREVEQIRASLLPTLEDFEGALLKLAGLRSLVQHLDRRYLKATEPTFEPRRPGHLGAGLKAAVENLRAELVTEERLEQPDFDQWR